MTKLLGVKDELPELYFLLEPEEDIWKILDKLALKLFGEDWMIDDHYQGIIRGDNHFSFNKNGIYLIIDNNEKKMHLTIIGLQDNSEIKNLVFESCPFKE